ncbi:hypothetical protein AB0N73_05940 [Microbacterium sp. NPDC089189]|uniref:hypothetical protein n=1 Tax=Microbacterium sp. NPDC089189 TaxID=3154972 RepID=UPI00343CBE92
MSIVRPVIGLVVAGLTVSAVSSLALDPAANDGAASFVSAFGVPMVVVALTIQLIAHTSLTGRRVRFASLWWPLAALPVGILVLAIPPITSNPGYFGPATVENLLGTLGIHALLILVGVLFGPLLWFFIVWPVSALIGAIVGLIRGEKGAHVRLMMPLVLLSLAAFILFGAGALDLSGALPGRFAAPQIVLALLGLPGTYEVQSPVFLWMCRVILVALVLAFVIPWLSARRKRGATESAPGVAGPV